MDAEVPEYFQAFLSTGAMVYVNSANKHKAHNMLLRVSNCVNQAVKIHVCKNWFGTVKYTLKFNNK